MTNSELQTEAKSDSLVRRLTRVNLLVLAVTMMLTFALIATASLLVARSQQAQSAEQDAQLLANSLAPMLVFEDVDAAQLELTVFARRGGVLEVQVLKVGNAAFTHWLEQGQASQALKLMPPELANIPALRQMHLNSLNVWVPIKLKGELVGALNVHQSLRALQHTVLRMVGVAAILIGLAILVAGRLLRWVQKRALAPIVELSELAEQVSTSQDYSQRARVHRADEVGRLSERFNQMLKRVEISQTELNQQLQREQLLGQQFEQLAHQDSLTQLPNRLYFQSALQRNIASSCELGKLMALMFIDLDNFKTVNDKHGHDAGDAVLREVAARMSRVLRAGDVLCRLGGDEFGLILPELADEAPAEALALRLIAAIREPMIIGDHLMPIGATVGLAFCPIDEVEASRLLSAADVAMYAAKRAGKNTFRRAGHAASS
ncbi:sensor domain-containing diguanylate cyclase [Roseateles oligotrophus]|uniref:Diguanylate cyclase n=1 Tax=Roseateles oligotrophus TaxID=1769250 RepID=A0ABT2Y8W9_9BURK|nr:sensor domain-containing diguanylate cyclase [Roseateles oligotrophus]MCV2366745.1 diguanylate cyclase [Roseateles oligotrophus]